MIEHCIAVASKTLIQYLVLSHAVTLVEDDLFAYHDVFIYRIVVKTVVGLAPIL